MLGVPQVSDAFEHCARRREISIGLVDRDEALDEECFDEAAAYGVRCTVEEIARPFEQLWTWDCEAVGLVAFEAQALGFPVLAASTTSLERDLAGDSRTFPAGDVAWLAALLDAVGQDGVLDRALASAAEANAVRFNVRTTVEGVLSAAPRAQIVGTR